MVFQVQDAAILDCVKAGDKIRCQAEKAGGAFTVTHKSMMKGMKDMQGMKPSGNMDRDFAMMMRHHHLQGIQMSQRQLKHGKDPKMREMAQKIMDSQKEIAEFDEWTKSVSHAGSKGK